ncbi:cell division cycle-associated protein 7-like [Styela clava]
MELAELDLNARLKSIFDETGEEDDFLGFSDTEVTKSSDEDQLCFSKTVEIENINQDSNSKTSGYGSTDDLTDSDSDILSDSEDEEINKKKREEAMHERRGILKNLLTDIHNEPVFKQMIAKTPLSLKRQHRTSRPTCPKQYYTTHRLPPVTRRRSKLGDPNYKCGEEEEEASNWKPKLLVRFGPKRQTSGSDDEESYQPRKRSYTRRSVNTQEHIIIPVEDVTDAMLDNIAQYSVGKDYNAINGTSCHQCRQKTMDTKSCCRNKECVGVRGQFCGPCLKNRYGESVQEALLDPDWSCPVCRGFCNCSICRNRNGKCATGILIGLAKHHGFTNVKDYLGSLKSENQFIEES